MSQADATIRWVITGKIQLRHALQCVLELAWRQFSQGGLHVQTCQWCYTQEQRVLGLLRQERCSVVSLRGTAFTTDQRVLATQVSISSHREVSAFRRVNGVIHKNKGL